MATEVDITINNVVCNFSVKCHINLRQLALNGTNVMYNREKGMVHMKVRKPLVTALIRSSGCVSITGSTSEEEAKTAARRVARMLQKLGFNARFTDFRITNILGTCKLPFGVKIHQFSAENRQRELQVSYEPELHPGVKLKVKDHRASMTIFQTGAMTITAPTINDISLAVQFVWPLVHKFKKD